MFFSGKLLNVVFFLLSVSIAGSAYEHPVINQSGQVGLVHLYSAKSLGFTRLAFNVESDLAFDKDFLVELRQKLDPDPRYRYWDPDELIYKYKEEDTLYPDPTFFNLRINASYGLTSFLDFSFMLPIYFDLLSNNNTQGGLGDMELGLKFRIPGNQERLFQGALLASFRFPTGSKEKGYFARNNYYYLENSTSDTIFDSDTIYSYYSSRKMESYFAALFTFEWKMFLFHLNSGVRLTHNRKLDEVFTLGTGFELHPSNYVALFTELTSNMQFATVNDGFKMNSDPFRLTPGVTLTSNSGMTFTLAGSFKLSKEKNYSYNDLINGGKHFIVGMEPSWQISAQLGWNGTFKSPDRDKDLILDKFDACPEIAEDEDNYEDSDGCPDLDNDHDAIPDSLDKCPNAAEDFDDYEDGDGCPELDNDQDAVADTVDRCPNEPEDKDGFNDFNGCPDYDNDNDGIPDSTDKCPMLPEDKDGFEDIDGCIDIDNDLDGVADSVDNCPDSAGVADEKGCPKIKPEAKEIKRGRVVLRGIDYAGGSSVLSTSAMAVLDQVCESMMAFKDIKLEIQAHTDNYGNYDSNLRISQARADGCRAYLIQKGISADRLRSVGKGQDEPIADNSSVYGRKLNNRIEIHRVD